MRFVRVYVLGRDFEPREVGRVYSDGKRIWCVPEDGRTQLIASQPIYLPDGDSAREIDPTQEPDEFLKSLPLQYRGTRLWCGKPEDEPE